jgi:hypothetical protein
MRPMPKLSSFRLAIAFGAVSLLAVMPVRAQTPDRALLSTFCEAAQIKADTCKRAKNYPNAGRRSCDVTLAKDRYGGRFVGSGNRLLVVAYDSGCEAHATDDGGAVVFEEIGGKYLFKNFLPGMATRDCVTLAKNATQDVLICLTGHVGQGLMETGVAQMAFTRDSDRRISIAPDFLVTAEDSTGAYGANVVTCKEGAKYFEVARLREGPRPETVTVEVSFADTDTVRTACGNGFPKPKETFGELAAGDAYVPEGFEKHGKLVIDVATRKIAVE